MFCLASTIQAQNNNYNSDTKTPQTLLKATLDVISGPKNEARDFDRLRNLFTENGTFTFAGPNKEGVYGSRTFSLEEFIEKVGPNYAKTGFYEKEIYSQIDQFNGVAQAIQTYAWEIPDSEQKARGINHYQMLKKGERWYISSLSWSSESEDHPIPAKYLNSNPKSNEMKRVTGLGGVFFKVKDPKKIGEWYEKHLGIKSEEWGGSIFKWHELNNTDKVATTTWGPFKDDTKYFKPGKKDYMFNYRVHDLDALLKALEEEGVEIVGEVQEYEYGKFGWIMDPEGNKIELWEPVDGVFE